MLASCFWKALPCFVEGASRNPIHHSTQVLDNMVQIALGEQLEYREFRISVVLALLHDIGNAVSQREKVKTDQVKDALKAGHPEEAKQLAFKAISFRLEHMDRAPELIADVTNSLIEGDALGSDDLHLICRAVLVHDYPSIEEVLSDLRAMGVDTAYSPGDFLLPLDSSIFGRLIERLREADRLFMVTEQGVLKDLRDANKKKTARNALDKLRSNVEKHKKEFLLYERVGKSGGFIDHTLYRTKIGYSKFLEFQKSLEDKWGHLPEESLVG